MDAQSKAGHSSLDAEPVQDQFIRSIHEDSPQKVTASRVFTCKQEQTELLLKSWLDSVQLFFYTFQE